MKAAEGGDGGIGRVEVGEVDEGKRRGVPEWAEEGGNEMGGEEEECGGGDEEEEEDNVEFAGHGQIKKLLVPPDVKCFRR